MDIISKEERSHLMAKIRGHNTKPEMAVRKFLFSKGFRYSLHKKELPGKPDIVLKKHNVCIFINGCFWHGHNCKVGKLPKSNKDFWIPKIEKNKSRDQVNIEKLIQDDWRVLIIWECANRGKDKLEITEFAYRLIHFITGKKQFNIIGSNISV